MHADSGEKVTEINHETYRYTQAKFYNNSLLCAVFLVQKKVNNSLVHAMLQWRVGLNRKWANKLAAFWTLKKKNAETLGAKNWLVYYLTTRLSCIEMGDVALQAMLWMIFNHLFVYVYS